MTKRRRPGGFEGKRTLDPRALARATVRQAQMRFGDTASEVDAVRAGWDKTKVKM